LSSLSLQVLCLFQICSFPHAMNNPFVEISYQNRKRQNLHPPRQDQITTFIGHRRHHETSLSNFPSTPDPSCPHFRKFRQNGARHPPPHQVKNQILLVAPPGSPPNRWSCPWGSPSGVLRVPGVRSGTSDRALLRMACCDPVSVRRRMRILLIVSIDRRLFP
jgi:hypothetical protein